MTNKPPEMNKCTDCKYDKNGKIWKYCEACWGTPHQQKPLTLEERVQQIEEWIDLWETYDSGWNKYRNGK